MHPKALALATAGFTALTIILQTSSAAIITEGLMGVVTSGPTHLLGTIGTGTLSHDDEDQDGFGAREPGERGAPMKPLMARPPAGRTGGWG